MPYLIDGNNLMYALADAGKYVGREGLCRLLEAMCDAGEKVCAVFDGPAPPEPMLRLFTESPVEVHFAHDADAVILDRIDDDSAPRRLTVVSTDHEIRIAARRRGCTSVRSEDFAPLLLRLWRDAARPPTDPPEPPEKREGLDPRQTRRWLREFHIEDAPDDRGLGPVEPLK